MKFPDNRYKARRQKLLAAVHKEILSLPGSPGIVTLFIAGFDQLSSPVPFRQEKNALYFIGSHEPGLILASYSDGREILYIPHYPESKRLWVTGGIMIDADPADYGVDEIRYLGNPDDDYSWYFFKKKSRYTFFLQDLTCALSEGFVIGMVTNKASRGLSKEHQDTGQLPSSISPASVDLSIRIIPEPSTQLLEWFSEWEPQLHQKIYDFSYQAHALRRVKSSEEITYIQKAINVTLEAQSQVEAELRPGLYEYEVRALVEYTFLKHNLVTSFPTIVAAGHNATVLHYTDCSSKIKAGELVVVDCGAEAEGYAADITRTHAVGKQMSARQKELYDLVRAVQEYCISLAKPGLYLKNIKEPERSLHHLALAYFDKEGYARYFPHGLGHYLGLNVHDVGDYALPLQEGDVITIEPGIYIPEESIGIRIEDNVLITSSGCRLLSSL